MSDGYFDRLGDDQRAQEAHVAAVTAAKEAARALDSGNLSRARELLERALTSVEDLQTHLGEG